MMLTRTLPALAFFASTLAGAATITGTVTDQTTHKAAANDTVVLIGFAQGMQEVARTTTDARGRYSIEVPESGAPGAAAHLIRVDHQKATYFQPAAAGAHAVDVSVYDVAERVSGISTEADVLTMQTDPEGLHITENYFVKNDSQPALTQLSRRAYEIYLPPAAKLEASAAMGPGGMPVSSSPIPVSDPAKPGASPEPGHYAFVFPIRPGETRFQVAYHLPYSGSLVLTQRVALPTANLVVILPKSMRFTPKASDFQPIPDNEGAQTFVRKEVAPAQPVEFTIAGSGSMPREAQGAQAGAGSTGQGAPTAAQPDAGASTDTRPGGGLGPPIDTPDPLHKYKWWILSALALLLVSAAAWLLRKPRLATGSATEGREPLKSGAKSAALQPSLLPQANPAYSPGHPPGAANPGLLGALKDALFALETERLSGRTSEEEYQQLKASLEVVLRQALERETAKR